MLPSLEGKMLGFERKARLFCDKTKHIVLCSSEVLGFQRKARLFCDTSAEKNKIPIRIIIRWDLSVRLGYFVTQV